VAQIVTFGTLAAKASVRDVGRAMGRSFAETDRVAKLIPVGPGITIESALAKVPELKGLYEGDGSVRELIDAAKKVEGLARHASTHAAGVVISRDPLVEHVPLQRAGGKSEGEITTQYPMAQLESLGLLKMDFLGLKTLTVLGKAIDLLRRGGHDISLEAIPRDDAKSYDLLCAGQTVGVFQLEGGMTTRMTVDVAPRCFEDLIALMALIRPGPMEMAPDYIARKHGRTEIVYMHPDMEPILAETYGIALYQEQVIRIANVLAGFSMAEGDGLRKAMGKKLPEEMAKYRDRFVAGCQERGIAKGLARDVFDLIERFAGYGFNKAHSAAYAVIAAQTAYLKANHPVEFMAALLSSEIGNSEKLVFNVVECRRAGIPVLPPDVNASDVEFGVEATADGRWAVRFGLAAVKNVGEGAVRAILAARAQQDGGAFPSFEAFCEAVDWGVVNRRVAESLAKCGALDRFGPRSQILAVMDGAIAAAQRRQKATARGQIALFGEAAPVADGPTTLMPAQSGAAQPLDRELLAWEKELLGFYLSAHPLQEVVGAAAGGNGRVHIVELGERTPGEKVRLVAMIVGVRRITTKTNRTMAIVEIEDLTGTIELVAFPDCYERLNGVWQEDAIVEVVAKLERRGEGLQLVCESATTEIERAVVPAARRLIRVRLPASIDVWADIEAMQALDACLRRHEGEDRLVLHVPRGDGSEVVLRSRSRAVEWGPELHQELEGIVGSGRVTVEEAGAARLSA